MDAKLLVFARIDLSLHFYFGLKRKILGQVNGLKQLGYAVDLVNYSEAGLVFNQNELICKFEKDGPISKRLNYYRDSYIKLPEVINFKEYDFMFIRYQMTNHYFVRMLRKIKEANPDIKIVVEFPTFPFYDELISIGLKLNLIFEFATRNKLKKYVDEVITYCGQDEIYGIPAISISNAIDTNNVDLINYNSDLSKGINLFCVANITKFHAYDRLVRGLKTYLDNDPKYEVKFHVVGEGVEFENLKALTKSLGLEDIVIFYGFLKGKELNAIYELAHIGIGALGMHRKKLSLGSPLKIREYCAVGLPFVSASDSGFDKDFIGMVDVPSDESDIDIEEIVDFCLQFKPEYSPMLRQYAIEKLNWKAQLNKVFKDLN